MMPNALMIFCLLALAALSAIGLFALTGSTPRHGGTHPASTGNPPPVKPPYSPPLMTPLFAPVAFDDSTHTTMTSPTFQGFVCDSSDEKYHFQPFRCESGSTGDKA